MYQKWVLWHLLSLTICLLISNPALLSCCWTTCCIPHIVQIILMLTSQSDSFLRGECWSLIHTAILYKFAPSLQNDQSFCFPRKMLCFKILWIAEHTPCKNNFGETLFSNQYMKPQKSFSHRQIIFCHRSSVYCYPVVVAMMYIALCNLCCCWVVSLLDNVYFTAYNSQPSF